MKFLLLGETGAGKSTFINALANYFLDGNLKNPPSNIHVVIPTKYLSCTEQGQGTSSERSLEDTTTSKTSEVKIYTWGDYAFIDTPGFADTSGAGQDEANLHKILVTCANLTQGLSAIIFVLNGTASKKVASLRTVISRLRGNIPDCALNNLVYVVTNCSYPSHINFTLESLPFSPRGVLYMNNSAFSSDPKNWNTRDVYFIEQDWENSKLVLGRFFLFCSENFTNRIPTRVFRDILAFRKELLVILTSALNQIGQLAPLADLLSDTEAYLKQQQRIIEQNKNYKTTTTKVEGTKRRYFVGGEMMRCEKIGGKGFTTVKVESKVVYHFNPGYGGYGGGGGFYDSENRRCSECQGSGEVEYYENHDIVKMIEEINYAMKSTYDNASKQLRLCQNKLQEINKEQNKIRDQIKGITGQVNAYCCSIQSICSRFSFRDECEMLIQDLQFRSKLIQGFQDKQIVLNLIRSLQDLSVSLEPVKEEFGIISDSCYHITGYSE